MNLVTNHQYLESRGVSNELAIEFGVGVFDNRAYIRLDDLDGNFIDYVQRTIDGSSPKYQFPQGFSKAHYLYNFHRAVAAKKKALLVVEGFFDCLNLHKCGYTSIVALMGCAMSARQEHLLIRWWEHIIFMLDGDDAGRKMQKEAIARVSKLGVNVYGVNLEDKIQPDMLSKDQIQRVLSSI